MEEAQGTEDAAGLRARLAEMEGEIARLRGWAAHAGGDAARRSLERVLETSEFIGTSDWDLPNDRLTSNGRFAALFSVDPARAAAGVPINEYVGAIYPDDRPRVQSAIEVALTGGGD